MTFTTFTNGTVANATEVNANFLKTFLNIKGTGSDISYSSDDTLDRVITSAGTISIGSGTTMTIDGSCMMIADTITIEGNIDGEGVGDFAGPGGAQAQPEVPVAGLLSSGGVGGGASVYGIIINPIDGMIYTTGAGKTATELLNLTSTIPGQILLNTFINRLAPAYIAGKVNVPSLQGGAGSGGKGYYDGGGGVWTSGGGGGLGGGGLLLIANTITISGTITLSGADGTAGSGSVNYGNGGGGAGGSLVMCGSTITLTGATITSTGGDSPIVASKTSGTSGAGGNVICIYKTLTGTPTTTLTGGSQGSPDSGSYVTVSWVPE